MSNLRVPFSASRSVPHFLLIHFEWDKQAEIGTQWQTELSYYTPFRIVGSVMHVHMDGGGDELAHNQTKTTAFHSLTKLLYVYRERQVWKHDIQGVSKNATFFYVEYLKDALVKLIVLLVYHSVLP